jgi:protein scribble
VTDGGAAALDGKLRVGDRLISVSTSNVASCSYILSVNSIQINGVDVSDARHDQAVALLTAARDITLVVYRENVLENSNPSANASFGRPIPTAAPRAPAANSNTASARSSFFQTAQPPSQGSIVDQFNAYARVNKPRTPLLNNHSEHPVEVP